MNPERLAELGFVIQGEGDELRAIAELMTPLLNPLTRRFIDQVTFKVRDGRLAPVDPPALAGLAPQPVIGIERLSDFESQLRSEFDRAILQMQRRSNELQALGVQPIVDPESLELWAELSPGTVKLRIAADRQGNFRIVEASRAGTRLQLPANTRFEVSEFRDGRALLGYLETMVLELAGEKDIVAPSARAQPPGITAPLNLGELAERFGAKAIVPQKTAVEIVADLRVGEDRYRFAASRVTGRTFRGLLAGPRGKVWADRFELDDFPGVIALAARELGVAASDIALVGLDVAGALSGEK